MLSCHSGQAYCIGAVNVFISVYFCENVQNLKLHRWYLVLLPTCNTKISSEQCKHCSVSLSESQWHLWSLPVWQQWQTNCTMWINSKQHVQWYVREFQMPVMNLGWSLFDVFFFCCCCCVPKTPSSCISSSMGQRSWCRSMEKGLLGGQTTTSNTETPLLYLWRTLSMVVN